MSKAAIIDAVIASAIDEFSHEGFGGASLREIANRAGVTLSAIDRYFGNKEALYDYVHQRVWQEINRDRDARLAIALTVRPPRIEDLMRAMIEPVVLRAFATDERRNMIDLLRLSPLVRRARGHHGPLTTDQFVIPRRWVAAIQEALPDIPGDVVIWGYSFALGSLYSWQLLDHLYDAMLPQERELGADEIVDMLVAFSSAGLRALKVG